MLRKTVALLFALNLLWWVWANGWLAPLGLPATFTGEPQRLARQIHPEVLRVQPLPPGTPIIKTVQADREISATSVAPTHISAAIPAVSPRQKNQNRRY